MKKNEIFQVLVVDDDGFDFSKEFEFNASFISSKATK
jgi:hypothetical protein